MTTIQCLYASQKDLVVEMKKETVLNVGLLGRLEAMPSELTRFVIKENALEKPTQALFNYLSHYLVSIIDPHAAASLSWPLYDTKTEKLYRNELSNFISNYSNKGLLSPVTSSYLVNPGCYKVTKLIFQLSQLAVHKLLMSKMEKDCHKKIYNVMTEQYKSREKEYVLDQLEKETDEILSYTVIKVSKYLQKTKAIQEIEETMLSKITEMEGKTKNAQKYLGDLVDLFVSSHAIDDATKAKILSIKDVTKLSPFFDSWLSELDVKIDELESQWSEKMTPFLQICKDTQSNTESLIARHTGEADKDTYMIEYNHKTDEICTKDLQSQVNSEQKYILKNIVKDERLNFPNLIRGFLIAICFILKNAEIGDEVYQFNEYLDRGRKNYSEVVKALRELNDKVMNAEAKLEVSTEPSPEIYHQSVSLKDSIEIQPLRDLSDLRCTRQLHCQALFDSFTPLSMTKHKYNLQRKTSLNTFHTFAKPQSKSLLVTPFTQKQDNFMKSLISCRISSYDHLNSTQNFQNLSVISQSRANETIAECTSGFIKQQILRLLSTQKSSSSKKFQHPTKRPNINIKKGGLFNESNSSNESVGLFRSYSSPNLFENREKRSVLRAGHRKLSIMKEDNASLLEVSGIAMLDKDSRYNTPEGINLENSRKLDTGCLPVILVTPDPNQKFHQMIQDFNVDLNKEVTIEDISKASSIEIEPKTDTPKTNQLIRKTSSVEKLINRFKKVRAAAVPEGNRGNEQSNEIRTIIEEKENKAHIDGFTANRILLPDLLSPSCSAITNKSTDYLDQICTDVVNRACRKPRESLGTALGVDETFLDQFELID